MMRPHVKSAYISDDLEHEKASENATNCRNTPRTLRQKINVSKFFSDSLFRLLVIMT